jgi:hypothetical protein
VGEELGESSWQDGQHFGESLRKKLWQPSGHDEERRDQGKQIGESSWKQVQQLGELLRKQLWQPSGQEGGQYDQEELGECHVHGITHNINITLVIALTSSLSRAIIPLHGWLGVRVTSSACFNYVRLWSLPVFNDIFPLCSYKMVAN